MWMALIKCPECGREVSVSAPFCPSCGYPISNGINNFNEKNIKQKSSALQETFSSPSKKRPIIIGIAITVLVCCVVFILTRCEVDGCLNRRSPTSLRGYCAYHQGIIDQAELYNSYNSTSQKNATDLEISDIKIYTNSAATYCTGTITNIGRSSFKFVKVKGAFENRDGAVIETGDTYAVGSEGLEPGESTSFKIYCNRNSDVDSCTVTVYDFR